MTHLLLALLTAAASADGGDTDPARAADDLRAALLGAGPFRAVYEIAMPNADKRVHVEVRGDLPRACVLVSGEGTEQVRAYADVGRQMLFIRSETDGKPRLLRTRAAPMIDGVKAVRQAFIKAGLGDETSLPPVLDTPGAADRDGLHVFTILTLGPARDGRGRPHIKSGVGVAVAARVQAGSWLAEFVRSPLVTLTTTAKTCTLADTTGTRLAVSRATGLPTSVVVTPSKAGTMTLTLKQRERLAAFEPPAWAVKPAAGVEVEDADLPEFQQRSAAYTAWKFYTARTARRLAAQADWKGRLAVDHDRIVEALTPESPSLWKDHGRGVPRGLVLVLRGAAREADARFRYLKEPDDAKARAEARRYVREAVARRKDALAGALDTLMNRFRKEMARDLDTDAAPARAEAADALVGLIRQAARDAYVNDLADTIADTLMKRRAER